MSGWNNTTHQGWHRVRRPREAGVSRMPGRWTAPDVAFMLVAFMLHWEIGLAFLGLKLWHQASGYQGSLIAFVREKWDALVGITRATLAGTSIPFSFTVGPRTSGNHAFDSWRQAELARIETERAKLRHAERDFAAYRDELLHVKDREDFERFMQTRPPREPRSGQ